MLIDSHCHLDFPALAKDREGVLARARDAGIGRMLNVCTRRHEFVSLRATAEQNVDVFFSLGVHPHHVSEPGEEITVEELVEAAQHPKAIAIGETGLDYFYDRSPRDAQERSFRNHIRAAKEADLPVIIHSRDAEEDTLRILKEEGCNSGVLHCFSSRRFLAEEGLVLGLYVSFSGMLTFKKSEELRYVARDIPFDRLLVETDAPFLAPEPYRGKICEPAYVVKTAEALATTKGMGLNEMARQTTVNFFRLFRKCPPEALK
ncbi:MAG: TatD family hydrolase [Bdellovibrionales bacterium]